MGLSLSSLLLLLLALPGGDADSLFQEALYRRKVLGDLEGAIRLLERVAGTDAPVETRAKALLQRVECLKNLGRVDEAKTLFDEFAADEAMVTVPGLSERVGRVVTEFEILRLEARLRDADLEMAEKREVLRKLEELNAKKDPDLEAKPRGFDPDDHMERLRAEKKERKNKSRRLLQRAREFEKKGDLRYAYELLVWASEVDPSNVKINAALSSIEGRIVGRGLPTDDARSALEFEREIRRDLIPREVDRLYEEGRKRFAESDYGAAAHLFGAVLKLQFEYPELADVLVDRVLATLDFLDQAIKKGGRPSFLEPPEYEELPENYLETLFDILEGAREEGKPPYRFHPLAHLHRKNGPEPGSSSGEPRTLVPRRFPCRALAEVIRLRIEPGSWGGRDRFARIVERDKLVVRHEEATQRLVDAFVTSLASGAGEPRRLSYELVVLAPGELETVTAGLSVAFRDLDSVAVAVLDEPRMRAWARLTRDARRLAPATGVAPAGGSLRLDASRSENAIVGHREGVAKGLAVSLPVLRPVWEGIRLDTLAIPIRGGGATIGIEGEVSVFDGPFDVRARDGQLLRWPTSLQRPFAFAATVPDDGCLLLTGVASPFAPRRKGDVLCVLVVPGELPSGEMPTADTEGVRVSDLAAARDVPGLLFEYERIGTGPDRPHTCVELVGKSLAAQGLAAVERAGHLVATGDGEKKDAGRRALRDLLTHRSDLFEIRARALPSGAKPPVGVAEVTVEPSGTIRAWRTSAREDVADGDRLRVGRVVAGSLQQVHLSRLESFAYVKEYDPEPGGPLSASRPVHGSVGRGVVVGIRGVADGEGVLLSVLAKTAQLLSLQDEDVPYGLGTVPLPVTIPILRVTRARSLVRLKPGERLILDGLPDPFGDAKARLAIEIEVRRISR
jgi:tetratricopeptide (TPR) repeat protein